MRANRVDAIIVDKEQKRVLAIEMSCPWLGNRKVKEMEKVQRYGPVMWELRERNRGFQVKHKNIIIDVLGGYSADASQAGKDLVGEKSAAIYLDLTARGFVTVRCPTYVWFTNTGHLDM